MSVGLWIQTEYHSTEAAQSARTIAQERMARGKSVALSIGYGIEPGGAEFSDDGTRHLLKLKLFEVSQVNVPMLRQAGLTGRQGIRHSFRRSLGTGAGRPGRVVGTCEVRVGHPHERRPRH
jgi:phage head maturation protease